MERADAWLERAGADAKRAGSAGKRAGANNRSPHPLITKHSSQKKRSS